MKSTFRKNERLHKALDIKELYEKGSSFFLFPFKIVYLKKDADGSPLSPHSILVAVSKKKFGNATDRNRIKRLIREAYRLNKHVLPQTGFFKMHIGFQYIHHEKFPLQVIEKKITLALQKIAGRSF